MAAEEQVVAVELARSWAVDSWAEERAVERVGVGSWAGVGELAVVGSWVGVGELVVDGSLVVVDYMLVVVGVGGCAV